MHSKFLGPLAIVLLALGTAGAAVATSVSGPTYGDWNLPESGNSGFATGALDDSGGNTVFKLDAKLVETPSPSLSVRNGTIEGELDDGNPAVYPLYAVSGTWTSNKAGNGTFEASISRQVSPLGPVALIGKMAGKFSDSPSILKVGKFKGEWKANL